MSMGGAASKPEDVAKLASMKVDFAPPLGAPNPVSTRHLICSHRSGILMTDWLCELITLKG